MLVGENVSGECTTFTSGLGQVRGEVWGIKIKDAITSLPSSFQSPIYRRPPIFYSSPTPQAP